MPGGADGGGRRRRRALARPDLADGRAHEARRRPAAAPRMMAAMAQQDCGQCGYNCERLRRRAVRQEGGAAESLRAGRQGNRPHAEDAVRGDRRRRRRLRQRRRAVPRLVAAPRGEAGRSRDNPVEATFVSRTLLNKPGSEKETWHIEFDLAERGSTTRSAMRSASIRPTIRRWSTRSSGRSARRPTSRSAAARLREVLIDGVSLSPAPDMLFQLFSYITGGERRQKAKALGVRRGSGRRCRDARRAGRAREIPRRPARSGSLHRGARAAAAAALFDLVVAQGRIRGRVSLTVDTVRYDIDGRTRLGVASTFLAERIEPGDPLKVYVQKAHAFGLPADPSRADHHDRARHRRRAVPRLPARAHGDQGAGPQLAVLRPPAPRLRLLLRGRARPA